MPPNPWPPTTFALGMHEHAAGNTGHPEVETAFDQARTWRQDAHNLQLLTVYVQRIRRAVDKNMAQFEALQTERKEAASEATDRPNSCIDSPSPKANPTSRRHFPSADLYLPLARQEVMIAEQKAK